MYKIVRHFLGPTAPSPYGPSHQSYKRVVMSGLTLEEAQRHCSSPESSSKTATTSAARRRTRDRGPWFDGYYQE